MSGRASPRVFSIPPGTPFEQLPDDWTCPDCGAAKSDFELLGED